MRSPEIILAGFFFSIASQTAAAVSYSLKVVTFYQSGAPGDLVAGPAGSPDTSFARFTNIGPSTLSGTFRLRGTGASGHYWETSTYRSLAPGATLGSLSITGESSNVGGFNKVSGSADNGVEIRFEGEAASGAASDAVVLSVFDKDVHSGQHRTNPFGTVVDSYVLQGGDPFGRDTGDDFENSQAAGQHTWAMLDADDDGVLDSLDNCPNTPNPDQRDCNNNGIGDACESGNADCNSNGIPDYCDISSGTAADADGNGVPDVCQPDCNLNGLPDSWEIATNRVPDLDGDGIPDTCQGAMLVDSITDNLGPPSGIEARSWTFTKLPFAESQVALDIDVRGDLNSASEWIDVSLNGDAPRRFFGPDGNDCPAVPDRATIVIPREEFNSLIGGGGMLAVRLTASPSVDPTECKDQGLTTFRLRYVGIDPATGDCNANRRLDVVETHDGTSPDCNHNKIPDSCDVAGGGFADCNGNGVPDACELVADPALDCNGNGIIDSCDIASGRSADRDGNLVPDECQTVSVPGDHGTIQAAIDAAPSGVMRIVSVAAGTFPGPIAFNGKPVVVRGAGAGQTILSGSSGQQLSVVRFTGGEPPIAALERVTVRGGGTGSPFPPAPQYLVGGGILSYNSGASVRDCVIEQNITSFGVGAYVWNTTGAFERCAFRNNNAGSDGGGIQLYRGSPRMVDCIIEDNVCNSRGGGMHVVEGTPALLRTVVRNNQSANLVGGIFWVPVYPASEFLRMEDCEVTGNDAAVAQGGIGVLDATGSVTMSMFSTEACGNLPRPNVTGYYQDLGGNAICDCAADLVLDGAVNGADLALLLAAWGPCPGACTPDLDRSGSVNGADLALLLSAWEPCGD